MPLPLAFPFLFALYWKRGGNEMLVENISLMESAGAAQVHRTPEAIAEELAWIDQFAEECRRLNEIEPLPDNFEAICEGREIVPMYSKARAS
jgi:hypothetical protein